MSDITEVITHVLLIILIIIEAVVLLHLLYVNRKRFKQEQELWERSKELFEDLENNQTATDSLTSKDTEEDNENEQTSNEK